MLNVELKVAETTNSYTGATSVVKTAKQIDLVAIPDDDTYSGRDGRKIRIKNLQIKGTVSLDSSASHGHKMEIFLVRGLNSKLITQADVFDTVDVDALRNLDNGSSYKILNKWAYTLSGTGAEIRSIDIFRKLNHVVLYDKDSTDGTSFSQGQLSLLIIGSTATTSVIDLNINTRIKYLDN